jgi:NOL1/NOP2/fmu family ribosome biogenesis protein
LAKKVARFWPHIQKTGWFFIAKLRKIWNFKNQDLIWLRKKNLSKLNLNSSLQKKVKQFLLKNYEINLENVLFVESSNYIYCVSQAFEKISNYIQVEKIWIPILKKDRNNNYRPTHFLWSTFGHLAKQNVVRIDLKEAYDYALWKDIENFEKINVSKPPLNYVIVNYKGYWYWIAKLQKGFLKNKYLKS